MSFRELKKRLLSLLIVFAVCLVSLSLLFVGKSGNLTVVIGGLVAL